MKTDIITGITTATILSADKENIYASSAPYIVFNGELFARYYDRSLEEDTKDGGCFSVEKKIVRYVRKFERDNISIFCTKDDMVSQFTAANAPVFYFETDSLNLAHELIKRYECKKTHRKYKLHKKAPKTYARVIEVLESMF